MKIGIDISQIVYGTGVSYYTTNLVENLLEIDKENEYVFFAGTLRQFKKIKTFLDSLSGKFESKTFPLPPKLLDIVWNRFHFFPIEKFVGDLDVYHSSDWTQAPSSAFKVTTIHDLAPIKFRTQTPPIIYSAHKRRLSLVKKEVDRIIVPSETTKKDLA